MDRKFFICSVARPGEDYEAENFERCIRYSGHFMHDSTSQKGPFKKVRPGDIAILKYHNVLVAYGEVTSVSNDKSMSELGDWNHRIIVDRWIWHNPSDHSAGVDNYGISWHQKDGSTWATIKEVSTEYGIEKCGKIDTTSPLFSSLQKNIIMESYIKLLESNRNIILHGAPGTGKTYLAKEIAKAMDAETEFVQFHPNYDYTDFVEGLRPVRNGEDGNIGFELRPGIFRRFCEKALTNLTDSAKGASQLNAERNIKRRYMALVDNIKNGAVTTIVQRKGKPLKVMLSNQDNIIIGTSNSSKTYTISLARILKIAAVYDTQQKLNSITNITTAMRDIIGGCHESGYWTVLNTMYSLKEDSFADESSPATTATDAVKRKNFVFIIDEINRAEISKVFGELFFSIDPGYRGSAGKVRTQYANLIEEPTPFDNVVDEDSTGWFFIPENVYVIGTMNDIDRSVDRMDFAMRRRFAFREVGAPESAGILDSPGAWEGNMPDQKTLDLLKKKMSRLNEAIVSPEVGLSKAYMTGGAYYIKYSLYKDSEDPFGMLWEYHLSPLLTEYLRGIDENGQKLKYLKEQYDGI